MSDPEYPLLPRASKCLLRDTPEDVERLAAALSAEWKEDLSPAENIIEALRNG